MNKSKVKNKMSHRKSKVFYALLMLIPSVQFLLFYVYVNINSFSLAFRHYSDETMLYSFSLTKNFAYWFSETQLASIGQFLWVSLKAYGVQLVIAIPLGLLFSYYIFKKFPLSGFFRVMLFVPQIISALVVLKVYKYFVEANGILWFTEKNEATFWGLMIGNIVVSFGATVLIYTNKLVAAGTEVFEAAQIDGASGFAEFRYVAFPIVFSSFSVFFIQGVALIFTNQLNNFALFDFEPTPTETLGFFMFKELERANKRDFLLTRLSALGLMISAVTIPVTFLVRHLFQKYGPSED